MCQVIFAMVEVRLASRLAASIGHLRRRTGARFRRSMPVFASFMQLEPKSSADWDKVVAGSTTSSSTFTKI